MNSELLARVIGLIQKNGDRIVVADPETGRAVVVMDIESYERLCGASDQIGSVVPAQPQKSSVQNSIKVAKTSEENGKKKKPFAQPEDTATPAISGDLTQDELLDKINRDIGAWKTAQERKRTDELKSAAHISPRFEAQNASFDRLGTPLEAALEEEERFYLEPIE